MFIDSSFLCFLIKVKVNSPCDYSFCLIQPSLGGVFGTLGNYMNVEFTGMFIT